MADTPVPPALPKLPLRLVRPKPPDEVARDLRQENERLRSELEAERATVQVLRAQYSEKRTGPHEDTLPGVGATKAILRAFEKRRRGRMAPRRRVWAGIVAALLGLAATAAGIRYPGLMGPIDHVAKALAEAFETVNQ